MAGVFELAVFLLLIYCIFNYRTSTMVDVLSARMQAVYTKWEKGTKPPPPKKVSTNILHLYGPNERREMLRALSADSLQQFRDREIFRTKESPWNLGFPSRPTRPIMGMACKACTPDSKYKMTYRKNYSHTALCIPRRRGGFNNSGFMFRGPFDDFSMDYAAKSQDVQNILKTDTEISDSFFIRSFSHIVHIWKFKKFDFPQVSQKVLLDSRLKGAIEDTTKELLQKSSKEVGNSNINNEYLYKQILTSQEARARRILLDMRSTLSNYLLRIFTWLLYKLFPRFLTSVCLHPSQLTMLQKAASTNLPLIFVPLHRSHLDYILITFILLNIGVKAPLVAAGNNLRIPVFGWLLRGLGAFFIKRRIDPVAGRKDILYRAVLHTYMVECLRAGHNIEFYIEGGRTRTGKPCMPKGGLLSVIVGAYMDGTVEDALLVPVSVNYDKLVDGNFVRELLGQPKQMETFSSAISAIWTTLNSNFGSMRIDFNQPFSLRELVKSFQNMNKSGRLSQTDFFSTSESESNSLSKKNGFQKEKSFRSIPSTTSLYGTDVDEDHRVLVDKIARHLIYDCAKACAVMSTNTLAFLLLNKYRDGASLKDLVASFDKLRQQLTSDDRDVGFSGESVDVIEHAIQLLGPNLVKWEKKQSENSSEILETVIPVTNLPNVIELSYYSNALLPHFMMEGVVATSICCSVKSDSSSHLTVSMDDILRNAIDLCDILQYEFIFVKPCESLEYVISETIDKFKYMDILCSQESINLEYENWSQKIAKSLDDSEDDEFYQYKPSPIYKVNNNKEEEEKLELFHMILRPLIDTYTVTAMSLPGLVDRQLSENEFVEEVLTEIKSQLNIGYCSYGESSSVDPVKNALKLFKKWNVVEMYNQDSMRFVYLTDAYNNVNDVQPIIKKISHFKFLNESVD